MNKIYFFLIAVILVTLPKMATAQNLEIHEVSVEEAQILLKEGAIMVDVREENEVMQLAYQVEGILHVPLSLIEENMNELPKDKQLIIACKSGNRSAKAYNVLEKNGFSQIVNLEGGINSWQAKGYDVIVDGIPTATKSCCSKSGRKGKGNCSKKKCAKSSCKSNSKSSCCSKK